MCYFWFMDDAFVYFRYADNFVLLGNGLVYNQGEYVEGFTSPFWVLLLSLMRAAGITYLAAVRLVACGGFVLFGLMLVEVNKRLSPKSPVLNFPLLYLSLNYGVLCYFSSGLETPLVQVAAVAYALYILNPASRILQLTLAVSPLIRPELILPFIVCSILTWASSKKFPLRMVLTAAVVLVSWLIFRIYYYADLLPNPFYLKDTVDIKQGLVYVHETFATYHFYAVAVLFSIVTVVLAKRRVNLELRNRLMMLVAAVSVGWYVVKIGGDPRHYRYLAFPFCLAVCAFAGLPEHWFRACCTEKYRRLVPLAGAVLAFVVFWLYPPQLSKHPLLFHPEHQTVNKINDAYAHRRKPNLHYLWWREKANINAMRKYRAENPEFKYIGVAANDWCVGSYQRFDERIVHSLGLTDAILARTEMAADRPAHKGGLKPLAEDIARIQSSADSIGRGMYRKAVEEGGTPEWVGKNLETIEIIERKIYNKQNLPENLKLAFTFVGKIEP
jgi:hypothetical protein